MPHRLYKQGVMLPASCESPQRILERSALGGPCPVHGGQKALPPKCRAQKGSECLLREQAVCLAPPEQGPRRGRTGQQSLGARVSLTGKAGPLPKQARSASEIQARVISRLGRCVQICFPLFYFHSWISATRVKLITNDIQSYIPKPW